MTRMFFHSEVASMYRSSFESGLRIGHRISRRPDHVKTLLHASVVITSLLPQSQDHGSSSVCDFSNDVDTARARLKEVAAAIER